MMDEDRPHSKKLPGVKGIEVPEEVAAAEGLPDDLDASLLGPYTVVALAAIGAYHFISAFDLAVADTEALRLANQATEFPVGHASASVGFEGWRARPVWNILVFSAEDPPARRGLVRVDGVSGDVRDVLVEENPERFY